MSADIEQQLLGSLLSDPTKIAVARVEIGPEAFQDSLHSRIFAVIAVWEGDLNTLTPISLAAAMRGDEGLAELGGRNYLATLAMSAPALPNITHLASMVRQERLREDAMAACDGAIHSLMTSPASVQEALRQVMVVADMAAQADVRRRPLMAHGVAQDVVAQAEQALQGHRAPFVTTGLREVDAKIGGMQGGDFILVPGRSGMGKSALLGGICLRAALAGNPVLIFSLEMMAEQWMSRCLTDLDFDEHPGDPMAYQDFRRGTVSAAHVQRAAEAALRLHDLPLEICEAGDMTMEDIAARARAFKAKHRDKQIGLIATDYAQRVEPSVGKGKDRSREQEVAHVARGHKNLAKLLEWPVLAAAQLLTKGYDPKTQYKEQIPTLTAIRESGTLETEADIILAPHRSAWFHAKTFPIGVPNDSPEMEEWRDKYRRIKNSLLLYGLKFRHGGEFVFDLYCEMRSSAVRDEKPSQPQADVSGLLV